MIKTTLKETTMPQITTQATSQDRVTLDKDLRPDVEFDQWATAVREQMVAALKRRGSN